jgi:hypothetical protein
MPQIEYITLGRKKETAVAEKRKGKITSKYFRGVAKQILLTPITTEGRLPISIEASIAPINNPDNQTYINTDMSSKRRWPGLRLYAAPNKYMTSIDHMGRQEAL